MVVPAATPAADVAAESPHLGAFQEVDDGQVEEDDYGLFDLEEDGPTTAAADAARSRARRGPSRAARRAAANLRDEVRDILRAELRAEIADELLAKRP